MYKSVYVDSPIVDECWGPSPRAPNLLPRRNLEKGEAKAKAKAKVKKESENSKTCSVTKRARTPEGELFVCLLYY